MLDSLLPYTREMPGMLKVIVYCGWVVFSCWFGYWVLFGKAGPATATAAPPTTAQTAGADSTLITANQDGANNTQNIVAPGGTQINAPNGTVYVGAQQDLFAGTKYTKQSIEQFFPFGYVVFALRDGKRWLYDNQSAPELRWDVPGFLKTVEITPDFSIGKVHWKIAKINATGSSVTVVDGRIEQTTTLADGRYHIDTGFLRPNIPLLHLMTLSANQANPVFAIGFRIVPMKELNVTIPEE
jgi:hypothetical protein